MPTRHTSPLTRLERQNSEHPITTVFNDQVSAARDDMRRVHFCEESKSDDSNHDIDHTTHKRSGQEENDQADKKTYVIESRNCRHDINIRVMSGQNEIHFPREQTAKRSLRLEVIGLLEQMP
ncbi:MAG: hypothetical protein FJ267_11710 [Planctomycetes bacterium]|nr:hypothetical protein [Planctomycetota bacterium]